MRAASGRRPRIAVFGIGRPDAGDDAVGALVMRRLRAMIPAGVAIVRCENDPARLVEDLAGLDLAVAVDASRSGEPVGSVVRFDVTHRPLPVALGTASSHGFGLAQAIELARALGRMPARLLVWAIEAGPIAVGEAPSPEGRAAATRVAEEIACAVANRLAGESARSQRTGGRRLRGSAAGRGIPSRSEVEPR